MGLSLPADRPAILLHAPSTHTKQTEVSKCSWHGDFNSEWGPGLLEVLDSSAWERSQVTEQSRLKVHLLMLISGLNGAIVSLSLSLSLIFIWVS